LADWQVNGFGALTRAFVFELRPTECCEQRGASSLHASAC
jgi:hypothetical protein